jgi:hypothetical protein
MLVQSTKSAQEGATTIKSKISFLPFYEFIKDKIARQGGRKSMYLEYVISQFEQQPLMLQPIEDKAILDAHKDLIELVASAIFPATTDEHATFYSFTMPYTESTFYYSDIFAAYLIKEVNGEPQLQFLGDVTEEQVYQENLRLAYRFVIKKFYGFDINIEDSLIYAVTDPITGLKRFGRVEVDDRFVAVKLVGERPVFQKNTLCPKTYRIIDIEALQRELPLSAFEFHGFLVRNIVDVSSTAFADEIKDAILSADAAHNKNIYQRLTGSIQGLAGLKDAGVQLMPVLQINGELQLPGKEDSFNETMPSAVCGIGVSSDGCRQMSAYFSESGQPLLVQDIQAQIAMYPQTFLDPIRKETGSLLLFPVFTERTLIGIVELFSPQPGAVNLAVSNKMAMAYPLLMMAFEKYHDKVQQEINILMKNEFTAIQPVVEWKFVEVAWKQIQEKLAGNDLPLAPIRFKEVYPVYGAIDIRNSTIERTLAISKDLTAQLQLTAETFEQLQAMNRLPILDGFQYRLHQLGEQLKNNPDAEQETLVNDFLEGDIRSAFAHFTTLNDSAAALVHHYYRQVEDLEGPLHQYRRAFDNSLQRINRKVSKILEAQEVHAQESFPHYFEKYRSDGIEYNIYIGQSLAPQKKFDWLYLKNLRLWQLDAMADIAIATHQLEQDLPHPLKTTQLILAHHHPIDIGFRKDERKFDVEGAYNIRYEVVKKRLDKALIKDTGERLTQPGKIAIVYTHANEVEEYLQYVQYLQHKGKLEPGYELLEIDHLQGVSGLKAIRVTINFNQPPL